MNPADLDPGDAAAGGAAPRRGDFVGALGQHGWIDVRSGSDLGPVMLAVERTAALLTRTAPESAALMLSVFTGDPDGTGDPDAVTAPPGTAGVRRGEPRPAPEPAPVVRAVVPRNLQISTGVPSVTVHDGDGEQIVTVLLGERPVLVLLAPPGTGRALLDRAAHAPPAEPRSITCPRCRMTSWNPNDVRERYCGNCRDWTSAAWRRQADADGVWPFPPTPESQAEVSPWKG